MIEGKTKSGFAYQLSDDAMNNMELVDAMAELDDGGHPFLFRFRLTGASGSAGRGGYHRPGYSADQQGVYPI